MRRAHDSWQTMQALQTVRQAEQQAAEQKTAASRCELQRAEDDLKRAERESSEHDLERKKRTGSERMPPGGLRAAELQRREDYERHMAEKSRALERKRLMAARKRDQRTAEMERDQQELKDAIGERKAAEKSRERMGVERSKRAELEAELEAEDTHGSSRERR